MSRCSLTFALALATVLFSVAVANTSPNALTGEFRIIGTHDAKLCPNVIKSVTYKSLSTNVWEKPHNTITHDDVRCKSIGRERTTKYFLNSLLEAPNSNIPEGLINMLNITGQNINTKLALDATGESYYIGYEDAGRFCQGSKFPKGTVSFVFRPFNVVTMSGNNGTRWRFSAGRVFMIIVPTFSGTKCLYSADLPKVAEGVEVSGEPEDPEPSSGSEIPEEVTIIPPKEPISTPEPESIPEVEPAASPDEGGNVLDSESSEEADASEEPACFPATVSVTMRDGTTKQMSDLEIGDEVLAGAGKYSAVFMFTHKVTSGRFPFVRMETSTGRTLALSRDHYMYINGALAAAKTATVGDLLESTTGTERIIAVGRVEEEGLYNPQTVHGDIVVNGIKASTYTVAVEPLAAHACLAPVRTLFTFLGQTTSMLEAGADFLTRITPKGNPRYV